MSQETAWILVILFYLLPLVHVAVSRRSGPLLPAADARCPLGPRAGWIVMVLLLGPIGWLLYMRTRWRRRPAPSAPSRG